MESIEEFFEVEVWIMCETCEVVNIHNESVIETEWE